ncbi:MAG: heme A synthase [Frankiaceae bacterium]|nr:heme A synthase [Frankiaceae bacterium]MBV9869491.1 heme A synthase [Frankiaceae bacterium]
MSTSVSPAAFRRLAIAAAIALAAIVVTGGAVRLTSSGLGCPDWPRCTDTSLVAPASYHALVEFVNRVISGAVGIGVVLVAIASYRRSPRRRDLTWLSWSLVLGVAAQAVVGGLSVRYKLSPGWVIPHFLLSMVILYAALQLVHRADPAWVPAKPPAKRELVMLVRVLVAAATAVLVLGTITTGTGPHAGSGDHVKRLSLPLERVTQLHADSALLLTGLVVATMFAVRLTATTVLVRRRATILAGTVLLQVAIGYTQYFLNVPPGVVELHIAGATALWCAAVWLQLGFTAPVVTIPEPAVEDQTNWLTATATNSTVR